MLCIEPPAHTLQLDERRLLVQPVVGAPPERGGLGELRARRLELAERRERRVRLTAHLQNYRLRGRQSFEPPDTQSALVARASATLTVHPWLLTFHKNRLADGSRNRGLGCAAAAALNVVRDLARDFALT